MWNETSRARCDGSEQIRDLRKNYLRMSILPKKKKKQTADPHGKFSQKKNTHESISKHLKTTILR
jgi:hypothetical protein